MPNRLFLSMCFVAAVAVTACGDETAADWFWAKYTTSGELAANGTGVKLAGEIGKEGNTGCPAMQHLRAATTY